MQKPRILVLGAGYGALSMFKNLKKEVFKYADFTLINNNDYHYHTILLHEVAAGTKNDKGVQFSLKKILPQEVKLIFDQVEQIDQNRVFTKKGSFEYDYLVIGLGFASDSFGISGIEEHSLNISSFDSAINIKNTIQNKLESFSKNNDKNDLKFIVCGGGFTGIEFCASLAQELKISAQNLNIAAADIEISCIEAMPHILPMFDEKASGIARKRLENLGVKVWENSKILECHQDGVIIENNGENKKIPAHTIIWSAGVKGNLVIENSPYFQSGRSKIKIDAFLHPEQDLVNKDKIFVVGDCGALMDAHTQRFYPPTAQLASKEGEYLGKVFNDLFISKQKADVFVFKPGGSLCSLGKSYAVGSMNNKTIWGFKAYVLKRLIENLWNFKIKGISGLF